MASKREDVILALGLDPGTFSQDLAAAVSQMKGFSGAVATGHQTAAGAAAVDEKAHGGLLGTFKEFRKEQVQQGRMARFYAGELASIVPAGDAVKGKLQELIGIGIEGAAGGFGFGLAFEVAKFAIGGIIEVIQHAKKEEEELLQATAAMVARVGDETAKLRDKRMGTQDDDTTRAKMEAANKLLEKKNRLNLEYGNLTGDAQREAGEELDILNEQVHAWEQKNGKLETFVRVNQGLLGEQERARALREGETTMALEAQHRLIAASTDTQKIQAEWVNAIAEATNRHGLGLLSNHNLELSINNAYAERAKKLEEMRIGWVSMSAAAADSWSRGELSSSSNDALPYGYDPNHPALKAMADRRRAALEEEALLTRSGFTDRWTASAELPQTDEEKNAALRAAAARQSATTSFGQNQDLFQGTEEGRQKQLDDLESMYGRIDEWRQQDLIKEQTAEQMKAEVAARQNTMKMQGAQQFFGTLASMQNSSVKELAAIGKVAAIAQATIDTYVGMNKALAQGGFFGYAMAAAVGAAGFANVASIASTFEVGGWTGGLAGRPAGIVHGEEFVVRAGPAGRNRGLLEAMNAGASLSAAAVPVAPKVIIENHGTRQVYSDPQLTPEGVRLIARDEVHREAPRAVAADLHQANSRVSRALANTTKTERRR